MQTLTLEEPGRFAFHDPTPPSDPAPGQVLVRVRRIGVCGTDLHAFEGKQPFFQYPRILGHELGVEVAGLGPGVAGIRIGDRCAVRPYLACGHCIACRQQKPNCCMHIKVLGVHIDGGMQDWLVLPSEHLNPSESLSFEELALAEPLSIGAHAVFRSGVRQHETVLVVGTGPIGLAVIESLRGRGVTIAALEMSQDRLDFCKRWMPVDHAILGSSDPVAQIQEALGGDLPTTVFDCTGSVDSMNASFRYPAHGGKLIFVGIYAGDITFHDPEFHKRELTLFASRNATHADFSQVVSSLEKGIIDVTPWIQHKFAPAQIAAAFPSLLRSRSVLKPVVDWS